MNLPSKVLKLRRQEMVLVAEALLLIAIVRSAMLKLSIPRLRSLAKFLAGTARERSTETHPTPERITWAIAAAGRRMPGGRNCLAQAVAAEALLTRFGYPSEFRIGARRTGGGELQAHAWLESHGQVLIGAFELETYSVMTPTTP